MSARLGVDVGGTFTDVALWDERSRRLAVFKVPSVPANPADATSRFHDPTTRDRRPSWADCTMARATSSGSYIGGTGCGCFGIRFLHQPNCGVFTAGMCTMLIRTWLPSWSSSARTDSKKPRQANFDEQYADWLARMWVSVLVR